MSMAHFILGGARSGKSRRALELAEAAGQNRVFIAKAEAWDGEMARRISQQHNLSVKHDCRRLKRHWT
ncbi:MAG: bifunctional adenosylcobinamide kinase/adenosylcobinamide-phosphate guanylyltransferase [Pseudomonadota bacterium]